MKKIIIMMIAALICAQPMTVNAKSQLERQREKEYKVKIKKLKKEGWAVFGTSHSLEVALLEHYEKLKKEGVEEYEGNAVSTSKNIGSAKLLQNAIEKFSSVLNSEIKGRTTTEHGSEMTEKDIIERDHFLQGFETRTQAAIKGQLKPSLTLVREKRINGRSGYEFVGYFIYDMDALQAALMKSMDQALQLQEKEHEISKRTSEWIKEAFQEEMKEGVPVVEEQPAE